MADVKNAENETVSAGNVRKLISNGILIFAGVRPDQVPQKASESTIMLLRRAEENEDEPMWFGRFMAEKVNVLSEQTVRPRTTMLFAEEDAERRSVSAMAAMVYEEQGFIAALACYRARTGQSLSTTDLREEPIALPDSSAAYALVLGPFEFQCGENVEITKVEDAMMTVLSGAHDEFKSVMRMPVEVPIDTEQCG